MKEMERGRLREERASQGIRGSEGRIRIEDESRCNLAEEEQHQDHGGRVKSSPETPKQTRSGICGEEVGRVGKEKEGR